MSTGAAALNDWLSELEVLTPAKAGGLAVFGLRHPSPSRLRYLTLDEALLSSAVEVREVGTAGRVPTVMVFNASDSLVLMVAGEELAGAMQNRILNVSVMVPARSKIPIPVSCVEAGRWRYKSRMFSSSGGWSHSKLRARMARKTKDSYRRHGTPLSDQGEVWSEVRSKLGSMGSRSATDALAQVYEDHARRLQEIIASVPAPEGCSGAAFAFDGAIAGIDIFDNPSTLGKLWPKLIRSYAIDALEEEGRDEPITAAEVKEQIRRAMATPSEIFASPGIGNDVRFESEGFSAGCLLVEDQPVHLEILGAPRGL